MERKINTINYIEKIDTLHLNQSIGRMPEGNKQLPESISPEQWEEFLYFISKFLDSKEAGMLADVDREKIKQECSDAKKADNKSGWQKIRDFLSDGANAVTVLTPIASFVAANSAQISQWIQSIFMK